MPSPTVVIEITSRGADRVRREIAGLRAAAGPAGRSQRELARQTAAATRSSQQQARELAAATRGLRSLESSLGGAFRAESQLTVAQQRLNRAVAAGLVSGQREVVLRRQMAATFTTAAVNARSLSLGLAGIRSELVSLAAVHAPGGGLLASLAGRGLGAGALGSAAGVAGGVGLGLAGEQRQQRRLQVEALGLDPAIIRDVVAASLDLGIAVKDNIALINRLALANDSLQKSDQELLAFTTRLNQAIVVSGTSSQEASAGVRQLAQALASGRLQGDEFRSIMENVPVVARAISRGLVEMGVAATGTTGELRELSTAGELTSERIFEAFMRGSRDVEASFERMPQTIGRSTTIIVNSVLEIAGALGEATGLTATLQTGFEGVATAAAAAAKAMAGVQAGQVPPTMGAGFGAGLSLRRALGLDAPIEEQVRQRMIRSGQEMGLRAVPFGQRPPPPEPVLKPLEEALIATRIAAFNAAEAERALASARGGAAGAAGAAAGAPVGPMIAPAPMARAEAQSFGLSVVSTERGGAADYAGQLDQLRMLGQTAAQAQQAAAAGVMGATTALTEQQERLQAVEVVWNQADQAARTFAGTAASGITSVIFGAQGVEEAVLGITKRLAEAAVEAAIFSAIMAGFGLAGGGAGGGFGAAIAGLFGGGASAAGKQHGGRVARGMPYLVGERGPEPFIPDTSGKILSNAEFSRRFTPPSSMAAPKIEVGGVRVIDQRGRGEPDIETNIDAKGLATVLVRGEVGRMVSDGSLGHRLGLRRKGIARG